MRCSMNFDTQLSQFVLNAVADDYESFDTIANDAARTASKYGLHLERGQISWALQDLIRQGCIQAYRFLGPSNKAHVVPFSVDKLDELWFYITAQGKERLAK